MRRLGRTNDGAWTNSSHHTDHLLFGGFHGRFGGYGYGYGHRGIGLIRFPFHDPLARSV
jgi:hypothetical protein